MIKSVRFIPKVEAQLLEPSSTIAIISINGLLGIPPQLVGFHSILRLEFEDVREPTAFGAFTQAHAEHIHNFLEQLKIETTELDVIVHCKAGVSRSAAVAIYIANTYKCKFPQVEFACGANSYVLNMLEARSGV